MDEATPPDTTRVGAGWPVARARDGVQPWWRAPTGSDARCLEEKPRHTACRLAASGSARDR
jgi:hypothetical protein